MKSALRHAFFLFAVVFLAGSSVTPALAKKRPEAPAVTLDDRGRLALLCSRLEAAYDTSRGGFVGKDGRPSESAVEVAFRLARDGRVDGGIDWTTRALMTMEFTRSLMDTMSGGFAERRPSSDADAGAFTMRADVNARRIEDLVFAWQVTDDERWKNDGAKVVGYCDRILLDGRGGFVTAQVGDRNLEPASNGVAIHGWLRWASATADPRRRDFALKSIDRVWETAFDAPLGVLIRHGVFGEVTEMPQLADQVEMGRALLYASQLCARAQDLVRARSLAQVMVDKFEDGERHGFYTQASPRRDGTIRRAARVPEENARAALFLAELGAATGETRWTDAARRTIAAFDGDFEKAGLDAADWALALQTLFAPESPIRPVWRSAPEPPPTPTVMKFRMPRRGSRK